MSQLKAAYAPYTLQFKQPAVTSREVMTEKTTYYIKVWDAAAPHLFGIGECGLFRGLSFDDREGYDTMLQAVCRDIEHVDLDQLSRRWPSIAMGVETALADLANGARRTPYPSPWSEGKQTICINGLVWMGSIEQMTSRLAEKIEAGFRCVKLKIGAQDFDREVAILKSIRSSFSPDEIEIRLDANGAFRVEDAMMKLDRLSRYTIHSIEQPIRQGQWQAMARICRTSPIAVALDEELIGVAGEAQRQEMLSTIRPQYIILKPTLCGGFAGSAEWIALAESMNIGWWVTSALESDIGLNAIAQWTARYNPSMPQGLGTGALYINNIKSPIRLEGDRLAYDPAGRWQIPALAWIE